MRTKDLIMMQLQLSTTALVKLTADQRSMHDQIVSVNFAKLSFKLYLGDKFPKWISECLLRLVKVLEL